MIIMQLSKQKTLSVIVNFTIGFFFLSLLSIKNGYNIAPALLIVLGLGYSIYGVIKKWQWSLSKEDKMLICSYLFYFATFVLSFIVHQGKIRELDNPSRVLLFIPVLLLLLHIPPRLNTVLYTIPLGAMIAGITAIYDKLVLHSKMAFSVRIMHIQGGDIAMSLGMFSVAIGFYFFQKTQLKQTTLCTFAGLCGILGSILSTARGGWIGVPFILTLILWVYRQHLSKRFFLGLFSILIIAGFGINQLPNNRIAERVAAAEYDISAYLQRNDGSTSVGARFDMWKSALLMAQEKPWLGWGVQGVSEKRKQQFEQGLISQFASGFNHAHNQYLDDLSKRGIVGLLALIGVFFVPFYLFWRNLKSSHAEQKLAGLLGVVHILSVMFYGMSQAFFSHNSGNIFYFFLVIVFYAFTKQQRLLAKHATV